MTFDGRDRQVRGAGCGPAAINAGAAFGRRHRDTAETATGPPSNSVASERTDEP